LEEVEVNRDTKTGVLAFFGELLNMAAQAIRHWL
jgi:hypothetical protein